MEHVQGLSNSQDSMEHVHSLFNSQDSTDHVQGLSTSQDSTEHVQGLSTSQDSTQHVQGLSTSQDSTEHVQGLSTSQDSKGLSNSQDSTEHIQGLSDSQDSTEHVQGLSDSQDSTEHVQGFSILFAFLIAQSHFLIAQSQQQPTWISEADLLRQFYTQLHQDRGCRSDLSPSPVTVQTHQDNQYNCLIGLEIKASTSRTDNPEFNSRLFRGDFFQVKSYQWLQNWHSSGYPARRLVS